MNVPPWLGHLRTDRRGIPVPFINLWGDDTDTSRLTVAHDPHVGMRAVFYDDTGQAVPDFTQQHMARQRQCMVAGLCQVCGRPVPWRRRFLVVADLSAETVEVGGRRVPVLVEPWLDGQCARFALEKCPALIRRRHDEALTLVAVDAPSRVSLVVSTGWVDGPLEAETRARPVAMWVKLLLLDDGAAA